MTGRGINHLGLNEVGCLGQEENDIPAAHSRSTSKEIISRGNNSMSIVFKAEEGLLKMSIMRGWRST